MPNRIIGSYLFGDMRVMYAADDGGHVGMIVVPDNAADKVIWKDRAVDSLVQLYIRGDNLPAGFAAGVTMSAAQSTYAMKYESQTKEEKDGTAVVTTTLADERGYKAKHILSYEQGSRALKIRSVFENLSDHDAVLEHISSFSLGMLTPFGGTDETDALMLHRARSWWSAEGKAESGSVLDYHLEQSWSGYGARVEKFGQIGSMPVRGWFPYAAVEDKSAGVVWAAQLACPSSWQMEFWRQGSELCLRGGLADYDYGHWQKTVRPGESFETPDACLTSGEGGVFEVSQRLLDLHRHSGNVKTKTGRGLPVVFNEYCTTWGNPSEENIESILGVIKDKGFDYFVIDAGWYCDRDWGLIGDWNVNEKRFPEGLSKVTDMIRKDGMIPGIWFELENCSASSEVYKNKDMLLTRNGFPITSGRTFLDMKKPQVREYLRSRVIDKLRGNGFGYIKIDYNDSIGVGCDDADGLGEGLRKSLLATQSFMDEIHERVPGIVIECCSSGGHRLEPSMLNRCDMASFSDAHECVHIPIIAANLHRLMQPSKSQIWAVLRKTDSIRRINYSLVNTFLGVMCVSGDVYDLTGEQWAAADRAISFYKKYSHIIRDGESHIYGSGTDSYLKPTGWQAVVRRGADGGTLAVIHTFGGKIPEYVALPVDASRIKDAVSSENNEISISNGYLKVQLKANFEAVAVALE